MASVGETLGRKIGPLPVGAWLLVVGGGVFFARQIKSVDNAEEGEFVDATSEDVDFPASQLRPVVGEHFAPELTGPLTIPFPETGGIVIPAPGEEPIIIQPTSPAPLPGNNPPSSVPSFFWAGRRWKATERGAFSSFIRSRKPLGYRTLREWINGVNVPGGVKREPKRQRLMNHRTLARRMGWV